MKWFPWVIKEVEVPVATNEGKTITESPCHACKNFKPQVLFRSKEGGMVPDGVRICHAGKMYQDFSCYRERDGIDGMNREVRTNRELAELIANELFTYCGGAKGPLTNRVEELLNANSITE